MKGLLKEEQKRIYNLITTLITLVLVLVMLTTTSYAWLYVADKAKFGFTSASGDVVLYTAIYQGESGKGQYVWDNGIKLKEQTEETFGNQYVSPEYQTHLGTVDNLSFRNEANNLWVCVKIKKTAGVNFSSLRFSFDNNEPYKFFHDLDSELGPVQGNDPLVTDKIDSVIDSLLRMDSLIISGVEKENFFTQEATNIPNISEDCMDAIPVVKYLEPSAKSFNGTIKGTELESQEYYYVYFRMYCVLDSYANIAEEISAYMPCVIQFNFKMTIIVDGKENI